MRVQAVGVDQQRHVNLLRDAASEGDGAVAAADARPEHDRAGAFGELDDGVRALLDVRAVLVWQSVRHRLHQPQVEDGLGGLGYCELHVARAGAHRREGRHRRCAGEAARAARDHDDARLELVAAALSWRNQVEDALADQAGDLGSGRAARDADIDDLDTARVRLPWLYVEADLRSVERRGDIRANGFAQDLARGRVDCGGNVACDHGGVRLVDRADCGRDRLAWL